MTPTDDNDSLTNQVREAIAATGIDTVTILETAYAVTALDVDTDPEAWHWTILVERVAPGRWAVRHQGRCWNYDMQAWDYEHIPSARSDDFKRTHRADLDTALARAAVLATTVTVNGLDAAGYRKWKAEHA